MLRVSQASRILNVHANTLRRWSDQGIINTYRVGPRGDRRFDPEDLAEFLAKGFHSNAHPVYLKR